MGRLFLTEWIRKCFIDEGTFELDPEESRFRHEKMEGREFHVREQSEQTPGVRKEWSSGENRKGHVVPPGIRAGREKRGS